MEHAASSAALTAEGFPAVAVEEFDTLVRLSWAPVFRFVLASIRDRDAAESITQDCFVRAYHGRSRFRGDCAVTTWLLRIALNLVRDYGRNRRLRFWRRAQVSCDALEWEAAGRDLSPEVQASAKEELRAVWDVVHRLSEKQRTVFLLRFVEDLDLLEIAAVTGMKEGTVKVHLFRALQAVRAALGRSK